MHAAHAHNRRPVATIMRAARHFFSRHLERQPQGHMRRFGGCTDTTAGAIRGVGFATQQVPKKHGWACYRWGGREGSIAH